MPVSKKRKRKNGKPVKGHDGGARIHVDPDKLSALTLQDLINVVAYQDVMMDGEVKGITPKAIIVDEVTTDDNDDLIEAMRSAEKNNVISEGKPPVYGAINKIAEENEDGRN